MNNSNVAQGSNEKAVAMLRDPRQQCLYVYGRRRGHGLYLKALKEASEARHVALKKA